MAVARTLGNTEWVIHEKHWDPQKSVAVEVDGVKLGELALEDMDEVQKQQQRP